MSKAKQPILTPVTDFGAWTCKREDLAAYTTREFPSGSKVRQYAAMAKDSPGVPMIVGCSAHSAMQIYVAAAARQAGVPGIIYTAARKERTAATQYAIDMGAEVNEIRPAYLSVIRSRAKERAKQIGAVVRWDPALAVRDAAFQCQNIPKDCGRVVVATGSGLTCAGILAGLAQLGHKALVLAVAVSPMATVPEINAAAMSMLAFAPAGSHGDLPTFGIVRAPGKYEDWAAVRLPDDTVLDPYYGAKAWQYVAPGDCLWLPGLRPLSAMEENCRRALFIAETVQLRPRLGRT